MRALLIDGGQSGCRAAVVDHGRTLATTALPACRVKAATTACCERCWRATSRRRRGATAVADGVDVVAAGLTGFAGEADAVAAAVPAPTVLVAPRRRHRPPRRARR